MSKLDHPCIIHNSGYCYRVKLAYEINNFKKVLIEEVEKSPILKFLYRLIDKYIEGGKK